jgi:hypothetical protein
MTGAGIGAYFARHGAAEPAVASSPAAANAPAPSPRPVVETQPVATVPAARHAPAEAEPQKPESSSEPAHPAEKTKPTRTDRPSTDRTVSLPDPKTEAPTALPAPLPVPQEPPAPADTPSSPPQPEPVRAPQYDEVVLPTSSVIGLQVETSLSSERARVEDRVEARVTRDVVSNGHVAIPAGSRVLGSVILVDHGGKLKDRARLGIRFHTLVLADGAEVQLNTEPFYRDGESPAGDSAKKIGGAAAVGAIIGGIIGGGKGAVIGGSTGAGAGTAATMAGDRNPATLASGSIVTVRLASPVTIEVERRDPQ